MSKSQSKSHFPQNIMGENIVVNPDKLFDTDAFEQWLAERSDFWPQCGAWQKSYGSNSHYCIVSAVIVDSEGDDHDITFRLQVSDHAACGKNTQHPEVAYLDMPQSQKDVQPLAHDYFPDWRDIPGITWNVENHWEGILKAIDDYCVLQQETWDDEAA